MAALPPSEKQKLIAVFNKIDTDGNGMLSRDEIHQALETLGMVTQG